MEHDGNGWTTCGLGHRHWGLFGAAGLALMDRRAPGPPLLLLQHRSSWTANGGTWGIPGGARDSHESAVEAALREAYEETRVRPTSVRVVDELVDDHGGWTYTSVRAELVTDVELTANEESADLRWVPVDVVAAYELHPGFARTWPMLLAGAAEDRSA